MTLAQLQLFDPFGFGQLHFLFLPIILKHTTHLCPSHSTDGFTINSHAFLSQHLRWLLYSNLYLSFSPLSSSQKEVLPSKVNSSPYVLIPITTMQKLQTSHLSFVSPTYCIVVLILQEINIPKPLSLLYKATLCSFHSRLLCSYTFSLHLSFLVSLHVMSLLPTSYSLSIPLHIASAPTC